MFGYDVSTLILLSLLAISAVSTTPVTNLPPVIDISGKFAISVVDTVVKFAAGTCRQVSTGVNDYGGKFAAGA